MLFNEDKVINKVEEMINELRIMYGYIIDTTNGIERTLYNINGRLDKIVYDNEKAFNKINDKLDKLINANEPKSYELSLNHDEMSYLIKLLETELAFNRNNTDNHTTYLDQKLKEVFFNEK